MQILVFCVCPLSQSSYNPRDLAPWLSFWWAKYLATWLFILPGLGVA